MLILTLTMKITQYLMVVVAKAKNDLLTKKYLDQRLNLTKKYLDQRLNRFDARLSSTKKYLDERLSLMGDYINERFDEFGEKITEMMNKRFDENKRDLLTIKDEIITELKNNRDNQEMHDVSHERINKDLDDHEERIEVLEASSRKN